MANRLRGTITRLYVNKGAAIIGLDASGGPKDGYFRLNSTCDNYNAMYSLALSAAVNRLPILIRTEEEISPRSEATVEYLVVDW